MIVSKDAPNKRVMKEQLISLNTAKLAKEKGLKLNYCPELFYPNPDNENEYITCEVAHDWELVEDKDWYSRPTQSLLQKWLRDIHNIHVNVSPLHLSEGWRQQAYNIEEGHYKGAAAGFHYKTFEEALEKGLQEALKLIK